MASRWRRPLLLASACWGAFVVVLAAAYWLPAARWGDGWAVEGFLNLHRPWLKNIAVHVAHLANPLPFALLTVLLASIALVRGRARRAGSLAPAGGRWRRGLRARRLGVGDAPRLALPE